MKLLVVVCVVVGVVGVVAQPQGGNYFEREEQEPEDNSAQDQIPYADSGYRPTREFLLPTEKRDLLEPANGYNDSPPPPPKSYNYDDNSTTPSSDDASTTSTEAPTTPARAVKLMAARADPDSEVEGVETTDAQKPRALPEPPAQGVYYVLLPTGQLQKVQYLARVDDLRTTRYAAQREIATISRPIYSYNPQASFLQVIV